MTTLFHVSDLHFGAEDRAALDAFAALVRAEQPNAVVVTGDLTMSARGKEFLAARDWLSQLGVPIVLGVGNHDLPVLNVFARFLWPYRRYRNLEKLIAPPIVLPGVSIIPLKTTARFQWRLNWSKGYVSRRSLEETLRAVSAVPAGQVILVACHHPLIEAGTMMPAQTRGGADALAALARAGADAVLSGHVHDPFDLQEKIEGATIRLIGAWTMSERLRDSPTSFNHIRVDGSAIQVQTRPTCMQFPG